MIRGEADTKAQKRRHLTRSLEFFNGLLQVVPSYAPFTTPAYANTAFQILGYALETIKGKSFQSMMEDSVLKPLGLNHTYYASPPNSVGLIPGTPKESGWSYQLGDESPYVERLAFIGLY